MVFSGRKEYPTKMSFDFLETKLIKIEQIIKKTGTIKAVEKYLNICSPAFRGYRRRFPKLELVIQKSLDIYKDSKFDKFTEEKLQMVEKIMGETGMLKAVAEYLKINPATLNTYLKTLPKLNLAIRNGQKIYDKKGPIYGEALKKVEEIMRTGYKKDLAKYLNLDGVTLRAYIRKYTPLREAIERGEKARTKIFFMKKDKNLPLDFVEYNLIPIEKVARESGEIRAVAKYLGVSTNALRRSRMIFPPLEEAIRRGLKNRFPKSLRNEIDKDNSLIPIKTVKEVKPPIELVNKLKVIEDDTAEALRKYREKKEEERIHAFERRVRNGEFKNMIGC
jgi:hypothetical protein